MNYDVFIVLWLGLVGLAFGSFVNAAVWRIREKRNLTHERSECVHCHHQLAAKDLVPVLSWLWLRGKCRYCRKPISSQYPIVELLVAIYFVASYLLWPADLSSALAIADFVLWLSYGVMLAILFVYDLRWFLLPDVVVWPLVVLGVVDFILAAIAQDMSAVQAMATAALALIPISGVYYLLYVISKGRWVGFGDVKLGLLIGLALGTWQLSFLALFIANLVGILVILPGLISGKLSRTTRIPFGPFLIAGFVLAGIFGQPIIDWYAGLLLGASTF